MSAVETAPAPAPGPAVVAAARSERRWPFRVALAGGLAVALGLRLWGIRQGLAYAYNADENAHFVPRGIGLFGDGINPHYFLHPPPLPYPLHAGFAVLVRGP